METKRDAISLAVLLAVTASCDWMWPLESPYDERRCSSTCPADQICFEGRCVDCVGENLGGRTCATLGFDGGELRCSAEHTIDPSGCFACGDDLVNGPEQCDGADLAGETCVSRGLERGQLACQPDCTFDLSSCHGCGNGAVEQGEECDGTDLGGQRCATRGFFAGELGCTPTCTFDTSACHHCGNLALDPGEDCDGSELGKGTCSAIPPFHSGTLKCDARCAYDTSGCKKCGDGERNGPTESCDGADLGGATCITYGFQAGTLACNADCTFDSSGCLNMTWTDASTGLTWQVSPPGATKNWLNAQSYCDGLSLGGHADWRLPTISELRSLIIGCSATVPGGICDVTDSCLNAGCGSTNCVTCPANQGPTNGCYWLSALSGACGRFWSSSPVPDRSSNAWYVQYDHAGVNDQDKGTLDMVRCVR